MNNNETQSMQTVLALHVQQRDEVRELNAELAHAKERMKEVRNTKLPTFLDEDEECVPTTLCDDNGRPYHVCRLRVPTHYSVQLRVAKEALERELTAEALRESYLSSRKSDTVDALVHWVYEPMENQAVQLDEWYFHDVRPTQPRSLEVASRIISEDLDVIEEYLAVQKQVKALRKRNRELALERAWKRNEVWAEHGPTVQASVALGARDIVLPSRSDDESDEKQHYRVSARPERRPSRDEEGTKKTLWEDVEDLFVKRYRLQNVVMEEIAAFCKQRRLTTRNCGEIETARVVVETHWPVLRERLARAIGALPTRKQRKGSTALPPWQFRRCQQQQQKKKEPSPATCHGGES